MVNHGYQTEIEKRWENGAQNTIYQSISEKNHCCDRIRFSCGAQILESSTFNFLTRRVNCNKLIRGKKTNIDVSG